MRPPPAVAALGECTGRGSGTEAAGVWEQNTGWSRKPALAVSAELPVQPAFLFCFSQQTFSRGRRECGCRCAAQSTRAEPPAARSASGRGLVSRGVAGSRRVLQLPLPMWTVDGKGGRAAAWPDGAVRARLSSAGAGWEGVWSVTCPTGLHVSCSLRSWRPAEGPQGPMQGVLASGRCL